MWILEHLGVLMWILERLKCFNVDFWSVLSVLMWILVRFKCFNVDFGAF